MTTRDDLAGLAGRYADGHASAAEIAVLEHALHDDADFRRWFVRLLHLDAALVGRPGIAVPQPPLPQARPANDSGSIWAATAGRSTFGWWARTSAAAAALLLILVGTWLPGAPVGATAATVHLVASTNAVWSDPESELSLRSGDLPRGLLRLESGSAEFRFPLGASAVLLGPAEVRFDGPHLLHIRSGQVLCRCPTLESRLTLTTPTTRVIDLGTEFAVAVAPDAGATQVTVISGAVQVGTQQTLVLHTGQSAEIRRDRVLMLTPLPAATFASLIDAATPVTASSGPNLLRDPLFSGQPPSAWRLTEGHAELHPADGRLAISARGHRFWPSARQRITRSGIAGHLVAVSVVGTNPSVDPLQERQSAILKLVFIDDHGREIAQASRHFLIAGTTRPDEAETGQVAAYAPAGTHAIDLQLMLNARGRAHGSAWFREPTVLIVPAIGLPVP